MNAERGCIPPSPPHTAVPPLCCSNTSEMPKPCPGLGEAAQHTQKALGKAGSGRG